MSIENLPNAEGIFYDPASGRMFRELRTFKYDQNRGISVATDIRIAGKLKRSTHIIFYIMTGNWSAPKMLMDHKDGNGENNRWGNLREATPAQNQYNKQSTMSYKRGLVKGVQPVHNRFTVRIRVNGINTYFGSFTTKEEANEFAIAKHKELHGEHALENRPFIRRF